MLTTGHAEISKVVSNLKLIAAKTEGLSVNRLKPAKSKMPFPTSEDLERCLKPVLQEEGFKHHEKLQHPRNKELGFEYDFWRASDGVAMEIMGYRADDEVYKDLLKFHVHAATSVGVLWVPQYKWISGKRSETNYRATIKAVAFADTYMNVNSLVVMPYDWTQSEETSLWKLTHVDCVSASQAD